MTTQQHIAIAHITEGLDTQRWLAEQAVIEAAALAGELGTETQLRAMSEQYKALKAAGETVKAAAVRAAAVQIYEGAK